ncbi:MAG: ABC transporter ATP-binding protein [Phascolarctobacterium sp.]
MALLQIDDLQKVFYTPDGNVSNVIYVPELTLERGESMVVDGPSGCGKTTILHLISGLLSADRGSIVFDGQELLDLDSKGRAQWRNCHLGYILQKLNLLGELNVLENVLLPLCWQGEAIDEKGYKERAKQLLEQVGLSGKIKMYPEQLSIGEQQRVAVVRALLKRPALVLADEPTASLDKVNGERVLELLQQLCKLNNTALLISTHDESIKRKFSKRYNVRSCCYE